MAMIRGPIADCGLHTLACPDVRLFFVAGILNPVILSERRERRISGFGSLR
jgi:hypothetical protein